MSRMVWDPWAYKYRPVLPQTDGTLISCSSTYVSLIVPVGATAHSIQFYEFGGGSVFQVAATANGVTYNPATPVPSPVSTGTGSTSATSVPNGAVLHFGVGNLVIPAVMSIGFLAGSLSVL